METTANQFTFDFVLEKRRFGKSTIAQNVGIMGINAIPKSINKCNGLKAIRQLPAILDADLSRFEPGSRLPDSSSFFIQREFINFSAWRSKSEISINRIKQFRNSVLRESANRREAMRPHKKSAANYTYRAWLHSANREPEDGEGAASQKIGRELEAFHMLTQR